MTFRHSNSMIMFGILASLLAILTNQSAVGQKGIKVPEATCKNGDCNNNFNWAGHTPKGRNGSPLPAGVTCVILLNQNVWICVDHSTLNCTSTIGCKPTCHGRWIDPETGQVEDCWCYAYIC